MCVSVVRVIDHHRMKDKKQSTYIDYCIQSTNFKKRPTWYSHLDPPTSMNYISHIYLSQCLILNFSVSESKYRFSNYYNVLFKQLYWYLVYRIFFYNRTSFSYIFIQISLTDVINYNLYIYNSIFNLKNNTSIKTKNIKLLQ